MKREETERLLDVVIEVNLESSQRTDGQCPGEGKEGKRMERKGDRLGEEIPMLLEFDIRPISIRFMFTCDDDTSERSRVIGKDVACIEKLLKEEL